MNPPTINIDEQRNQLSKYLLNIAPKTNTAELSELIQEFTYQFLPKNSTFIKSGEVSSVFYFISKGVVRVFYEKEDKEITNILATDNMIVVGAYSVITGEPSFSNYETIEDTFMLKIDYNLLTQFYAKYHSIEYLGRKIVEFYYAAFMKKTYDILFLSAEERYSLFIKNRNDLQNRIPLKFIASYLGITQETLSRLRAKS